MQCPQCGLANMPGSVRCFQCQAELANADSEPRPADFYPTRAKERGLERGLERRRAIPQATHHHTRGLLRQTLEPYRLYGRHFLRGLWSLLPGLAQLRNHEPRRAKYFAGTALFLALAAVVLFRFWISNVLAATVGIVVVVAVVDGVLGSLRHATREPIPLRVSSGLVLTTLSILFSLWVCGSLAVGRVVVELRVPGRGTPFETGEVLLGLRSRSTLDAGDWIAVHRSHGERGFDRAFGGDSLEHVVAGPGQRVQLADGRLSIDGRVTGEVAAIPPATSDLTDVVLPAGSWLTVQYRMMGRYHQEGFGFGFIDGFSTARVIGITRRDQIVGRLIAVSSPPSRRRWLDERDRKE